MTYEPAPHRWSLPQAQPLPGMNPLLGRILAARGLDLAQAGALLNPPRVHHDPFDLRQMREAVSTIAKAVAEGRRIAVYGDFDCDGVTATALLVRALRAAGVDALPYIPNRMTEGYGLHAEALEELSVQGIGCVVSVDCGISSADVAASRPAGMLLAITDHHLPLRTADGDQVLAGADAVVNPKQQADHYPFDGLAGAGVAFKLVQALEESKIVPQGTSDSLVGLAALGTIGDMMPLVDENRAIVAAGLRSLATGAIPGISALCEAMKIKAPLRAEDLAFSAIPCINAAGRLQDAALALDLCLATTQTEAKPLVAKLIAQNSKRKLILAQQMVRVQAEIALLPEDTPAIVLGLRNCPMGIVGLLAGRAAEMSGRPALVVSLDGSEAKGSARSNSGVQIVQALERASGTLLRYGGHALAAGFSLEPQRFDEFRVAIQEAVKEQLTGPRERLYSVDAVVAGHDINSYNIRLLDRLQPFGMGNRQPLLALLDATVLDVRQLGSSGQHWVVKLMARDGAVVEAVSWNEPTTPARFPLRSRVDLCGTLQLDSWMDGGGKRFEKARLRLLDARPSQVVQLSAPSRDFAA